MAGNLRRWWVHTLTEHLVFSFQARLFIPGNKQGAVRALGPDASSCPQEVIFSSVPGGQLFSQEPGQALSVVSETKALTYTLLARLITFYIKLKIFNS